LQHAAEGASEKRVIIDDEDRARLRSSLCHGVRNRIRMRPHRRSVRPTGMRDGAGSVGPTILTNDTPSGPSDAMYGTPEALGFHVTIEKAAWLRSRHIF
jgi:hypothetical protein